MHRERIVTVLLVFGVFGFPLPSAVQATPMFMADAFTTGGASQRAEKVLGWTKTISRALRPSMPSRFPLLRIQGFQGARVPTRNPLTTL